MTTIFGASATANLTNVMNTWVNNWKTFYTGNGLPNNPMPTAHDIDIAARAAAFGDGVGFASTALMARCRHWSSMKTT